MSDPRRLFDDPEAPAELRAALAAERHLGEQYDPTALGARVAQAVAAGAPLGAGALGTSWWLGPKAMLATAVVSAALGAGGHALYTEYAAAPAAPVAPTTVVAPAPAAPAVSAPPAEAFAAPPPPAKAPTVAQSTPRAPRDARAPGALADELSLYERGEAALVEGHYDIAVRELERYLGEFPRGTLRAEAELALVQAFAKSGRCERADARARRAAAGAHREALLAAAARCGVER
ncbi:MAG: hypothetical protein HYS27_10900 [Deltaproteobacteria bacterium]|nr:hypothetical protein [Deltaproteobacteria bacterium]